jgi:hypothetical protein
LAFIIVGATLGAYAFASIDKDVVSPIVVINAGGVRTALVVYQPGLSSFPRDVCYALADGLASSGWRVEITTASPEAPSNFSLYSLLTLAYPIYGGKPGNAIMRYIDRLSDLNGTNTVIIACQGGTNPSPSIDTMKQKVQAINGTFLLGLSLSTSDSSAIESARQAGSGITP